MPTRLRTTSGSDDRLDAPLLARLLDAVENLVCVFEPAGRLLLWNSRLNELTGYADDALARLTVRDLVPARHRKRTTATLEKALEEGKVRAEIFLRSSDGDEIPLSISVSPVDDGDDPLLCGIGRDVRELRETRAVLQTHREKNRHLFHHAPLGVLIVDQSGEVHDLNPEGASILGVELGDLKRADPSVRWIDPDEPRPLEMFIRDRGNAEDENVRLRLPDGSEIVCRFSIVGAHLSDRGGTTYFAFFRDQTAEHRTRRELVESEDRYRRLFRYVREAVVLTHPEGPILDCNPAAEELLGYRRDELLEMRASELFADPEERSRRVLPMVLDPGEPSLLEVALKRRDGAEIPTSVSVSVHRGRDGEVAYLRVLLQDVTDERRAQRRIVGIQERERRRIGRDLHDGVAAQLTGMLMRTDRLVDALEEEGSVSTTDLTDLREELRESLREVRTLSRRLNPLRIQRSGLIEALRQLALEIRTQAEIDCRLSEDWPGREPEKETATHLFRIVQEALQNVLQHADASRIEVRLQRADGHRVVEIEDDGRGLGTDEAGGPADERAAPSNDGLGFRTMRDRAALIGGRLELSSGETAGRLDGTLVRCYLAAG